MNIWTVLKSSLMKNWIFKFFKGWVYYKKDYLCAIDVWNVFKINEMGD